jgi:hypothetical protein
MLKRYGREKMLSKDWTEEQYKLVREILENYLLENPMSHMQLSRLINIHHHTLLDLMKGKFPLKFKTRLLLMNFIKKNSQPEIVEKLSLKS